MWLGLCWLSALWGFELPSIQRGLGGLIAGQCKSFVSIPWYFVTMGSSKSESVISSLSIPWIFRVSICFRIWLQFHTPDEIYLLAFPGYIYGPQLWIEKQPASSQTFCVLSIAPAFSIDLILWRTARGLLRRSSPDLHHRASVFAVKKVEPRILLPL